MYLLFLHIIFLASPPQHIMICMVLVKRQSVAEVPSITEGQSVAQVPSIAEVLSVTEVSTSVMEQHKGDVESSVTLGMDVYSASGEQSADLFRDVATAPVHQHEKSLQWK